MSNEIKKDLKVNIRLLAERLNYHPYYLNEVFRKNEGMPIHKYLNRQRLIRAAELLSESATSQEEIAFLCGFSSQSHFSTAFKKEYGVSPSTFRKFV